MNLKQQRQLILGATQAVHDFWEARAASETDPEVVQFCRDHVVSTQRSVDHFTSLIEAVSESDPAVRIAPAGGPA